MAERRNDDELGALWIKQGRNGEYMTGTIDGQRVVVFRNTNKRTENQPDWRVLRSTVDGSRRQEQPHGTLGPGYDDKPIGREQAPEDDIPF